jgi:hypothetical protein
MNVGDYFSQGRRGWVRLHEKGGKEHERRACRRSKPISTRTSQLRALQIIRMGRCFAPPSGSSPSQFYYRHSAHNPIGSTERVARAVLVVRLR